MLEVYSQSIDSQLRNVNNYMNTLVGNSNVQLMQVSTNARTKFAARNEVSDHLSIMTVSPSGLRKLWSNTGKR